MAVKDLLNWLKKEKDERLKNLQAWGEVARTPELRQEYTKQVAAPAAKKAATTIAKPVSEPLKYMYQGAYQSPNINPRIKSIGQGTLGAVSQVGKELAQPFRNISDIQLKLSPIASKTNKELAQKSLESRGLTDDSGKVRIGATAADTGIGLLRTGAFVANPAGYSAYRSFPAVYGALGPKKEGEDVVSAGLRGLKDYAGPSRALRIEGTKKGDVIDTAEMLVGLLFNKGIDDVAISSVKNAFAKTNTLEKLIANSPVGIRRLRKNNPEKFNEFIASLYFMSKEDRANFGKFAQMVEKNARGNTGETGVIVDKIINEFLGEEQPISNKGIKSVLDWMVEASDTLKAEKLDIPNLSKMPGMSQSFAGEGDTVRIQGTEGIQRPLNVPESPRVKIIDEPDNVLDRASKQIGEPGQKPKKNIRESLDQFYTDFVNRFHPIEKLESSIEDQAKVKILPEKSPKFNLMRVLGAGSVAEQRHQTKLQPIIDQLGDVPKRDFDLYLKAKRDLNLASRGIKGSDADQANEVINALGSKYDLNSFDKVAQQLYEYQDQGLKMLQEAGVISQDAFKRIKSVSKDYVPFQRVMDDISDYLGLPTNKAFLGSQPVKRIKGSERKIISPLESIIADTYKIESAVSRNRAAQSIVNLRNIAPEFSDLFKMVKKSGNDTITVWSNGKKEYWQVGEDIAQAVKGLNEESMNTLTKILSVPASILRQGATGRNVAFMIPNAIRDQFDAAITSKYGYRPFWDYLRGLGHVIKHKYGSGDELVEEWINSGGKIFSQNLSGRKEIAEQLSDAQKKGLLKQLGDWAVGGLDTIGDLSETPTRIGLYQRAKEATGNPLISALESREGSLDFARMGAKMKTANAIIPFLNVGVQGFDKLIRTAAERPGKLLLNAALYVGLPATMASVYNNTVHPDVYAEIPDWEKDTNFIIVKGRDQQGKPDYIKIPVGNVAPLFSRPIDSLISYAAKTDPQSVGELALSIFSDTMPILEEGKSFGEVASRTIGSNLPQLLKPAVENIANYSFFKNQDIVPSYMQNRPAEEQYTKYTPEAYKAAGEVLGVSPLKLKNMLEGYLAGYVKTPVEVVQTIHNALAGKPLDKNNLPIARRFIGSYQDSEATEKPLATKDSKGLFGGIFSRDAKDAEAQQGLPEKTDQLEVLYNDAASVIDSYEEKKAKIEYGNYRQWEKENKLAQLEEDYQFAQQMLQRIETDKPQELFKVQLATYASGAGPLVEDRAEWAAGELSSVTNGEEFTKKIDQMLEAKVLTKDVVDMLREEYSLPVNRYTSGGKIKTIGGSGSGTIRLGATPKFAAPKVVARQGLKLQTTRQPTTVKISGGSSSVDLSDMPQIQPLTLNTQNLRIGSSRPQAMTTPKVSVKFGR